MTIEREELTEWYASLENTRVLLAEIESAARRSRPDEVAELVSQARAKVMQVCHGLDAAGADRPPDRPILLLPLHLLSTERNRHFARKLREAYEAGRERDEERGWDSDGPSEYLRDWAESTEMECYGPEGAGEGVER